MFDWLTEEVSQSAVTYPVVALAATVDVLFPLIPSETIVITASVLAAQGDLLIWVIVPAVALLRLRNAGRRGFEVWRRVQGRRGGDILGDELPEEAAT